MTTRTTQHINAAYVRRNYEALRREVGSEEWRGAADLILIYRALDDPDDAPRQCQARAASLDMNFLTTL